jgi:hypothetical protein
MQRPKGDISHTKAGRSPSPSMSTHLETTMREAIRASLLPLTQTQASARHVFMAVFGALPSEQIPAQPELLWLVHRFSRHVADLVRIHHQFDIHPCED